MGLLYVVTYATILISISVCNRRMKMSQAFKSNSVLEQEYATKGELHYGLHVSYERMAKAVREGKLAVHPIDGKVQLKVEEVVNLFFPPRKSLFD
jgi:hypothetical protein